MSDDKAKTAAPKGGTTSDEHAKACEAAGLDPAKVQPGDPALTGVPRDERRDSIDPNTGLLTEEAQAIRRAESEAAAG